MLEPISGRIREIIAAFAVGALLCHAGCVTTTGGTTTTGGGGGGSTSTGGSGSTGTTGTNGSSGSTVGGSSDNVRAADYGDPSPVEQFMLELTNRARSDPAGEATRLGLSSVDEGVSGGLGSDPRPPLSMNSLLLAAARKHSTDMLARDFFDHPNPDGDDPFDRMQQEGYSFSTAAENIAFEGTSGTLDVAATTANLHDGLFVDDGISGRGHRVNILNGDLLEVGIGIDTGEFTSSSGPLNSAMATQDFATASSGDGPFVVGVVYNDLNGNQLYNPGEELAGVIVELDGLRIEVASSGGYSFSVDNPGTYSIQFDGTGLGGVLTGQVTVSTASKKVDAIAGTGLVGVDP